MCSHQPLAEQYKILMVVTAPDGGEDRELLFQCEVCMGPLDRRLRRGLLPVLFSDRGSREELAAWMRRRREEAS